MLRYKEIKNMLIDRISGMQAGETIPSRTQLCRELDTTRTTIDKAIKELEEEKVLESRKGSGTRVIGLIETAAKDVHNICVIVPNVSEQIYSSLLRGIDNAVQNTSTNIILCNSDNNSDKQEQYISRLMKSGVSGFIMVPTIAYDAKESSRLYESLVRSKIPFIFCNRGVEGIDAPVVKSNDFYGGYIAVKHLLDMGYSRIAYIGRQRYRTSIDRCQGYISAIQERGISVNRKYIMMPPMNTIQNGYEAMQQLLGLEDRPDAVFCFNDYVAEGVVRAIEESGLRVSEDIGVIGYDNTDVCERSEPKLTSVSFKSEEIGEMAVKILFKEINGSPPPAFEYYLFQPSIVQRGSCLGPEGAT